MVKKIIELFSLLQLLFRFADGKIHYLPMNSLPNDHD
jgi:hypothetical protein